MLKLYSETITHKTDVGGVQLNLKDEADVRKAFNDIKTAVTEKKGAQHFQGVTVQQMIKLADGYEIILGSSIDPQFGPVLLFGMGGQLVEVFKDNSLALPPLNTTLARRMMERTKIYNALKGVRGRKPVDLAALEKLMVGFSQLVAEQRWIKEIDINPLFASGDDLVALDARVILHDPKTTEEQLPKLAIRPYPTQYVGAWKMKDGKKVTIRPIRPEDEPLMVKFHEGLSERSVYLRYFSPLKLQQRVAHSRLIRICFNDYDREIALVAEHKDGNGQVRDRRRGPAQQAAQHQRRRVRRGGDRPMAAQRAGHRADQAPDPDRQEREARPPGRLHPAREQGHAAHVQEGRLPGPHPRRRIRVRH